MTAPASAQPSRPGTSSLAAPRGARVPAARPSRCWCSPSSRWSPWTRTGSSSVVTTTIFFVLYALGLAVAAVGLAAGAQLGAGPADAVRADPARAGLELSRPGHRGGRGRCWPYRRSSSSSCSCCRRRPPRCTATRAATRRPSLTGRRSDQPFLVSAKIAAISSILASSSSAVDASMLPFVPAAPASLVASLNRVCSCGYFSKCGGLK